MKKMVLVMIASILSCFLIWNGIAAAQQKQIVIGGSGTSSGFYVYFVALSNAIQKHAPGISATVTETGGVLDNIERIIRSQIDLGLTQSITTYECYYGKEKWAGKPHPELRWLWSTGNSGMAIFVRADSGIKSIYELTGKKFCAGSRGSGNEKVIENIFTLLGIKPNYYRGDFSDAAEAVQNGQIAGFAKWNATEKVGDALVQQINATTKLNFLSISEEDLKKVMKVYPYIIPGHMPLNMYKGQDYPVSTIFGAGGVLASTNMSPDLGYRISQAAWKGVDILEKAFPAVKEFHMFKAGADFSPIPLHAGAVKVCKELGIQVPQRVIPPEYK